MHFPLFPLSSLSTLSFISSLRENLKERDGDYTLATYPPGLGLVQLVRLSCWSSDNFLVYLTEKERKKPELLLVTIRKNKRTLVAKHVVQFFFESLGIRLLYNSLLSIVQDGSMFLLIEFLLFVSISFISFENCV